MRKKLYLEDNNTNLHLRLLFTLKPLHDSQDFLENIRLISDVTEISRLHLDKN